MSAVSTVGLGAHGVVAPAASLGIDTGEGNGLRVVARPIGLVVRGYESPDAHVEELFARGAPVPAQRCSPPLRYTADASGEIEVALRIEPPGEHLAPDVIAVRVAVPIDASGDCRLSFLLGAAGDLGVRVLGSAAPVGHPSDLDTANGLLAAVTSRPLGWNDLIALAGIVRSTPDRLFAALATETEEAGNPLLDAVIAACAQEPAAGRLLLSECLGALLATGPGKAVSAAVLRRIGEAIRDAAARSAESWQEQARSAMHAVAAAASALADLEAGERLQTTWEARRQVVEAELRRLRQLKEEADSLLGVEQLLAQCGGEEADLNALSRLRDRISDKIKAAERQLEGFRKKWGRLREIAEQEFVSGGMDSVLRDAKELVELLFGGELEARCSRTYRAWQARYEGSSKRS